MRYRPNAELVGFVNAHREKADASAEESCEAEMETLILTNLGVYFTKDELVFNLKELPHVVFACGDDLVRVPWKNAQPLLNERGVRLLLGG